ncbi:MAG: fused MFS/spermidine synthase [Beijerinckiaceae bacterium]|nr:fused MFS/spermidine synthase [Beijerinckiaceae bacterium]
MSVKAVYFQIPIVLSAFLLFLLQPIMAKQILPWFGGSASVWNTCVFFFQLLLLLGYLYAHGLVRFAAPRTQAYIHIGMLALCLLSLPVIASGYWKSSDVDPAVRILMMLATTVGLPYLLLSSTSPLLQAWYARTMAAPYKLFAISNAASLGGLLAYPFLIEPVLNIAQQAWLWSAGFLIFACACAYVAVISALAARGATGDRASGRHMPLGEAPSARLRLLWITLSALGSLALISITAFIAQNIASMPLIWVAPLAIYLITFILAFSGRDYSGWGTLLPALGLSLAMVASYQSIDFIQEFQFSLPIFMAGLFFICLFCHAQLAATKPHPSRLTEFYILVSLGGALGSLAGSMLAPFVLSGDFEMPITLALVAALIAWRARETTAVYRTGVALAAVIVAGVAIWQIADQYATARVLVRNFYSALRILDTGEGAERRRTMEHAGVNHGSQFLDPARRGEALAYYSPSSGVALAIARQRELAAGKPLAAGFIGLGAGALAAYGESGDTFRFYEINPQVIDLAKREFTYLSDSKANISLALGDARLVLEAEKPQAFDLIVVDAFSGDAIPLHLLTREAVAIYRKHLRPGGALLFHISNRFVDLQPPLARLALEENLHARMVIDSPEGSEDDDSPLMDSDWVLMATDPSWFQNPKLEEESEPLRAPMRGRAWTDDFNNILSAIRLGGSN